MRAGKLKKQIDIEVNISSRDGKGGIVDSWTTYAIRRARVMPVSGKEFFDADAWQGQTLTMFQIRYDSFIGTITQPMRVIYKSQIYDIKSIINKFERNEEMELLCIKSDAEYFLYGPLYNNINNSPYIGVF